MSSHVHDVDDVDDVEIRNENGNDAVRVLPGMQLLKPSAPPKRAGYLCVACWRRIPVGQPSHACFFAE